MSKLTIFTGTKTIDYRMLVESRGRHIIDSVERSLRLEVGKAFADCYSVTTIRDGNYFGKNTEIECKIDIVGRLEADKNKCLRLMKLIHDEHHDVFNRFVFEELHNTLNKFGALK